ncbi:MAG TPA: hypothetical protein VFE53_24495 [Mucilaginibacter sp.]|nr:hypothetical protein [Mucilaginibacter sp.]
MKKIIMLTLAVMLTAGAFAKPGDCKKCTKKKCTTECKTTCGCTKAACEAGLCGLCK